VNADNLICTTLTCPDPTDGPHFKEGSHGLGVNKRLKIAPGIETIVDLKGIASTHSSLGSKTPAESRRALEQFEGLC
jgi:hypothetical protein